MKHFELPAPPPDLAGPVKAWSQPVAIPTYEPLAPDKNPMFLEKRVYQGSSGRVYPLPFIDRIATVCRRREWQAVHLENEFLRVMVLPEIGGRIHVGLDKTNGYDFFYRQNVIKPALVGLAGPWISGGVEFNWPQHHRPATFMPVDVHIEAHPDGARTVWCSDHDPMTRLKGMHGVCLHPGKAYLELKVRLYNGSRLVQTFLWWANVGVRVHEHYQSFFPPGVHYVADHAKRSVSAFPLCEGQYYGVDYAGRAREGVPADETPRRFVPPGTYPANDLSWYANIPVPTSYMAAPSDSDFFGGYDHARRAGFVHFANHHISPGKKQWTWGNHEFGYAWERNLTDSDGPYVELMAGVYTDNQPDFAFLAPGETKTFSEWWYPIQGIGVAQNANRDAAVSLRRSEAGVEVGVCATGTFPRAAVRLEAGGRFLAKWECNLAPGAPLLERFAPPPNLGEAPLTLVACAAGRELIRYEEQPGGRADVPQPAKEPRRPEQIKTSDELYLTGLHLEQYRHATRLPEDYWSEALRRDSGDARCNNAMGLWHLRCGEFGKAEQHFRQAIQRLTERNPNPYDGEPYYNLGLALVFLDREKEAYSAFYKATWNQAWRAAGYYALAELDSRTGAWGVALEHLQHCLRGNADHLNARDLAVVVMRKMGRAREAETLLRDTLTLDPLDPWARHLAGEPLPRNNQVRLDIAFHYARAGLFEEAVAVLNTADPTAGDGSAPMVLYARGCFQTRLGRTAEARASLEEAGRASPDYCFPSRLEEMALLEQVVAANPPDARARYYLGNLLYDRRRHREAIELWEQASRLDPSLPVVWRNLGIAYFNVLASPGQARQAFEKALDANPADARVFYERDQLWKRIGESPERRLAELERRPELVQLRDDLSVELASLRNTAGQHEQALAVLASRRFQPWEGGEGLALGEYVRAHLALARRALAKETPAEARRLLEAALDSPENLGEAKHLLANQSDIHYWLGVACEACGSHSAARKWWEKAANRRGDFQQMSVKAFSEMTYYSALSLLKLGERKEAGELLVELQAYAVRLKRQRAAIDYFATSLPAMLLFNDDIQKRNTITATFLEAQAMLGLGDTKRARRKLGQVLQLDRNHALAADLLNGPPAPDLVRQATSAVEENL